MKVWSLSNGIAGCDGLSVQYENLSRETKAISLQGELARAL